MTDSDRQSTHTDERRKTIMKLKPIGIYRDADTKMPRMRAADYSTDTYDAVELRTDRKENPVIIMHSKRTAPLTWKVVYGFSEIFFRSFAEAVAFCNTHGFEMAKEQVE